MISLSLSHTHTNSAHTHTHIFLYTRLTNKHLRAHLRTKLTETQTHPEDLKLLVLLLAQGSEHLVVLARQLLCLNLQSGATALARQLEEQRRGEGRGGGGGGQALLMQ